MSNYNYIYRQLRFSNYIYRQLRLKELKTQAIVVSIFIVLVSIPFYLGLRNDDLFGDILAILFPTLFAQFALGFWNRFFLYRKNLRKQNQSN